MYNEDQFVDAVEVVTSQDGLRIKELECIVKRLEKEKTQLTAEISELNLQLESCCKNQTVIHRNKPFFFHKSVDGEGDLTVNTIRDLYDMLGKIGLQEIEFHLYRKDFEHWLIDVFQAHTLAEQIAAVREQKSNGEHLRNSLRASVKEWLDSSK